MENNPKLITWNLTHALCANLDDRPSENDSFELLIVENNYIYIYIKYEIHSQYNYLTCYLFIYLCSEALQRKHVRFLLDNH